MERKPVCKLVGADDNVFAIIGRRVTSTLKEAGHQASASRFTARAFQVGSYDGASAR